MIFAVSSRMENHSYDPYLFCRQVELTNFLTKIVSNLCKNIVSSNFLED